MYFKIIVTRKKDQRFRRKIENDNQIVVFSLYLSVMQKWSIFNGYKNSKDYASQSFTPVFCIFVSNKMILF